MICWFFAASEVLTSLIAVFSSRLVSFAAFRSSWSSDLTAARSSLIFLAPSSNHCIVFFSFATSSAFSVLRLHLSITSGGFLRRPDFSLSLDTFTATLKFSSLSKSDFSLRIGTLFKASRISFNSSLSSLFGDNLTVDSEFTEEVPHEESLHTLILLLVLLVWPLGMASSPWLISSDKSIHSSPIIILVSCSRFAGLDELLLSESSLEQVSEDFRIVPSNCGISLRCFGASFWLLNDLHRESIQVGRGLFRALISGSSTWDFRRLNPLWIWVSSCSGDESSCRGVFLGISVLNGTGSVWRLFLVTGFDSGRTRLQQPSRSKVRDSPVVFELVFVGMTVSPAEEFIVLVPRNKSSLWFINLQNSHLISLSNFSP